MKSLSLSTPKLVVLVGIPGSGKTYFGDKFSDTFGAPYINTSAIRQTLTDQPTYSSDEQYVVDMLSLLQLGELFKTRKTILFEGNTSARTHRTHIAKLAKEHGYEALFVWVQTDPATSQKRATRTTRGSKHLTIPLDLFERLSASFEDLDKTETSAVISGRHTYASQARTVLKRLVDQPAAVATHGNQVLLPHRRSTKNSIKIL